MFNGARIIGPAIAGILVASIGEGWCFFANAVSYIAVIVGLLLMRIEHPANLAHQGSPLENIIEGFALCAQHRSHPRDSAAAGAGEFCRHALRRADAGVRRPDSARRRQRAGHSDGRNRRGCFAGSGQPGGAGRREGPRQADRNLRRRIWRQPDSLFFLEDLLAVHRAAGAGGLQHDGADGVVQHAHSGHDAGPPARPHHVGVLHDVHGAGAVRSAFRRRCCASPGRAVDGGAGRSGVHRGRHRFRDAPAVDSRRGARADSGARNDGRRSRRKGRPAQGLS